MRGTPGVNVVWMWSRTTTARLEGGRHSPSWELGQADLGPCSNPAVSATVVHAPKHSPCGSPNQKQTQMPTDSTPARSLITLFGLAFGRASFQSLSLLLRLLFSWADDSVKVADAIDLLILAVANFPHPDWTGNLKNCGRRFFKLIQKHVLGEYLR